MSAKPGTAEAAAATKMQKEVTGRAAVKPGETNQINSDSAVAGSAREEEGRVPGKEIVGANGKPSAGVAALLQHILNYLPKFDAEAMIELQATLERELTSALESKGVCRCRQPGLGLSESRGFDFQQLKKYLENSTELSELNDIKKAVSYRIKLLTKGKTYRRRIINGREYWYEVYWDATEQKKKDKYIGTVPPPDLTQHDNVNGERG
jgi:hypothetical protein